MFKTLFGKQFATYFGALALTLVVLSVVLVSFYRELIISEKAGILAEQAKRVTSVYQRSYVRGMGVFMVDGITAMSIESELSVLQNYLSSYCAITDSNFDVCLASVKLADSVMNKRLDSRLVESVRGGDVLTVRGDAYGLLADDSLSICYPVMVGDGEMKAIVIISSSMQEINAKVADFAGIMLWCVALSGALALILIYLSSKTISKPMRQLSEAAKVISGGNFERRIEYRSKDEVGRLAESFNEMAESLANQERIRHEFIANVSHDLRSPLTSMRGFLAAMLDGTIPPEKHGHYLRIVMEESERLSKLANDVLDLNKVQAMGLELERSEFEMNELIRKAVIMFETAITGKEIDVSIAFCEEQSVVFADMEKISRVLYNLLDNAVKFTGENGSLALETRREGGKLLIIIRDSGKGISEEEQRRVFDRFYKADASRGQDKRGSGLGLAIVREFIWAHGETITLNSEEGRGCEFCFTLLLS